MSPTDAAEGEKKQHDGEAICHPGGRRQHRLRDAVGCVKRDHGEDEGLSRFEALARASADEARSRYDPASFDI